MSLKEFIFSKVFLRSLVFAVLIAIGILIVLLIWLNFYTRHGQARPVPDFTGLTVGQASDLAKESRLRYQIIDSVYTTAVERGAVAEQNPKPGFKVKKGRNIMLTINAFKPEMVAMPNLIDLSLRQAAQVLESSGLELGQRRYKPDLSINFVIEQHYRGRRISHGDSIQKGSVIDIVVGKGLSNERTKIPQLVGMKLDPAKNRIMESSLVLGTFIYDKTIRTGADSARAFVYKQNPDFNDGASVPIGSDIYLWLTTDSSMLMVPEQAMSGNDTIPSGETVSTTAI
jgi:eukaryotic-like serine/threonine-protein kinase